MNNFFKISLMKNKKIKHKHIDNNKMNNFLFFENLKLIKNKGANNKRL